MYVLSPVHCNKQMLFFFIRLVRQLTELPNKSNNNQVSLALYRGVNMSVSFPVPDFGQSRWKEVPENPLIEYPHARWAIGDPQLLTPGDFDGQWHIFFHGYLGDQGLAFFHQVSNDGIHWKEHSRWDDWTVGQNYLYCDGSRWIMYYTCDLREYPELVERYKCHTLIRAKTTRNFVNWTEEVDLILPETGAEREGKMIQARNPCVISLPDGRCRLYYSAGTVWLDDAGYEEPKNIFCAEADNPLGPFKKAGDPILKPDTSIPYRNYGCGAIKVFGYNDGYIAFYNPIWLDKEKHSRSQICMLASDDGLVWEEAACNPVITPTTGWRAAIVYQLDVINWKDDMLMYFNARDDWRDGIERIGCCRLNLNGEQGLQKLRKPFRK
ncbi:hypothetical protein FACS1894142_4230 [Spirochaetia bacterium]|nr:hypothetical protein FACS1894142_4230 [Spirochaetia bacterium]